jgi:two-component system, OmpR family, manganese sensing response regulator
MQKTKGNILCVDDDPDTREMLTVLLGLGGHEVMAAGTISEGIQLAIAHNIDLILLDWVLEDGTGIELCRELRSIGVTAPVLFYSGKDITNELRDDAMRAGAQGFLTKPVDVNTILQSVSDFIKQPKPNQ